jgi:hypothetical protein
MTTETSVHTRAAAILARLDRLPGTRHVWLLITMLSLGGMFELYDLFMTAYVIPGLMKAGLLANVTVSIFTGPALFVAATFGGLFIGTFVFGYVADRYGRRTIFTYSMLWYSAATLVMAFQGTGLGVCLWRLIAGIGIGVELVTIDTYISELVPKSMRGRAFAFNQAVQFSVVPVVAFVAYKLVPISPFGYDGWRWVVLIGSTGALGVWFIRRRIPESPRWLINQGRLDEAEAVTASIEAKVSADLGGAPLPVPGTHSVEEFRARGPPRRGLRAALSQPHDHADGVPVLPDLRLLRLRRLGADADRPADRHQSRRQPALFVHHRHRQPVRSLAGHELRRQVRAEMAVGRRGLLHRRLRHAVRLPAHDAAIDPVRRADHAVEQRAVLLVPRLSDRVVSRRESAPARSDSPTR